MVVDGREDADKAGRNDKPCCCFDCPGQHKELIRRRRKGSVVLCVVAVVAGGSVGRFKPGIHPSSNGCMIFMLVFQQLISFVCVRNYTYLLMNESIPGISMDGNILQVICKCKHEMWECDATTTTII